MDCLLQTTLARLLFISKLRTALITARQLQCNLLERVRDRVTEILRMRGLACKIPNRNDGVGSFLPGDFARHDRNFKRAGT